MSRHPSSRTRSTVAWRRAALVTLSALAPALTGCSLDVRLLSVARTLRTDSGIVGDGGSSLDARSAEPDGASSDAGRAPLSHDGGERDGARCGADGAGCDTTVLFATPFDRNAAPWIGQSGMTLAWQPTDADGARSSGSLSVSNTTTESAATWTFGAAESCVPGAGSGVYAIECNVFIPTGQGAGGAGLGVSFFSTRDCTGAALATYDTPPSDKVDAWVAVSGETTAPADMKSVQVRLVVPKPLSEPAFEASFDDVRLTRR